MQTLPADQLHLYTADFGDFDAAAVAADCLSWLGAAELQRYRRYHLDRHRHRFLLGRILLRHILSRYEDCAPADWELTASATGKPCLARQAGQQPLHFNLSHSGSCLAVLVGRQAQLGVDVERCDRRRRIERIAHRYFSPAELVQLLQLPVAQQALRFYQLWTLKEAYIKAQGQGLALGLANFSFDFGDSGRLGFDTAAVLQEQPLAWQFWQFPQASAWQAAVAVKSAAAVKSLGHFRLDGGSSIDARPLNAPVVAWEKPAGQG